VQELVCDLRIVKAFIADLVLLRICIMNAALASVCAAATDAFSF
jgi:hypothetical protein